PVSVGGWRHCLVRKTRPFPSLKVALPSILLELGNGNSMIAEPLSLTKRTTLPLPLSSPFQRAATGYTPYVEPVSIFFPPSPAAHFALTLPVSLTPSMAKATQRL